MDYGFNKFIKEKNQLYFFILFSLIAAVICVLMRVFYSFPFSYSDTGSYVLSAASGTFNVFRPMGYSKYIRFIHSISDSIYSVFYVNYFLLYLAEMFLLFSVKYLMKIKNSVVFFMFGLFMLTNARLIFSCNLLMSDGIFTILTILYITLQLWLISRPSYFIALISMVLLVLLCRIRYSGLFFIPVTVLVFFLSFKEKKKFVLCVLTCLPLITGAYIYSSTKKQYVENVHVDTFSGFGGWQSINNASVLLPEAKSIPISKFKTPQLKTLHTYIQTCPDNIFHDSYSMTTSYMWDNDLPYKIFNTYMLDCSGYDYPTQWAVNGKLYSEYAKVLIKEYPFKYLVRFIIPSLVSNFKFKAFEENDIILVNEKLYQEYYGLTEAEYSHDCKFFVNIEPMRKVLQLILWFVFLFSVILFLLTAKTSTKDKIYFQKLCLLLTVIVVLVAQSLSSPNTTWRYTLPVFAPMLIFITCVFDGQISRFMGRK